MKMKLFVLIGLLLAAAPAFAHHGVAAAFDRIRPLQVKGTVVKWEVTNPHSWIQMDAKGDDGKVVTWMIEGGSPNNLYRLGFTKDSLPPGSEIVVEGYQAKDLSTRAVGESVTVSDGRRLFLRPQARESDPETKK